MNQELAEDLYRGESPAKKLARIKVWSTAMDRQGVDAFRSTKKIFLASREGGDIGVLLALGVPPEMLVPVEHDAGAAQACQVKWPQVRVVHGSASDAIRGIDQSYGMVYLDYCSNVCPDVVEDCANAMLRLKRGSIVAVNVKRARERKVALKSYIRTSAAKEARFLNACKQSGANFPTTYRADGETSGNMDSSRARAIQIHMMRVGSSRRVGPILIGCINYHSRWIDSSGSPMSSALFEVFRAPREYDVFRFRRTALREEEDAAIWASRHEAYGDFQARDTPDLLQSIAVMMRSRSHASNIHLLLNIDKGSVAAFKAHISRGSYGDLAAKADAEHDRIARFSQQSADQLQALINRRRKA
jgi:hypothetical protein